MPTTPPARTGMVPVGEFALLTDALADLSLLRSHGMPAFLLPDPMTTPLPSPPFRLFVLEAAGLGALQLLAREATAGDPRVEACPQCGFPCPGVSPGRRLLGLAELVVGIQVAPVFPSCPRCGWSPVRDGANDAR